MFRKIFGILSPMQWVEFGVIIILLVSLFNFTNVISDGISNFFGFETQASLKETTIKQAETIKELGDINKKQDETIKTNEVSAKIDQGVVIEKFKSTEKIENKVVLVEKKKIKEITEINKKYDSKPQTAENEKQRDHDVSVKQITSLWVIYCSEAGDDPQCKNIKETT